MGAKKKAVVKKTAKKATRQSGEKRKRNKMSAPKALELLLKLATVVEPIVHPERVQELRKHQPPPMDAETRAMVRNCLKEDFIQQFPKHNEDRISGEQLLEFMVNHVSRYAFGVFSMAMERLQQEAESHAAGFLATHGSGFPQA
jgi:hypothetical protein